MTNQLIQKTKRERWLRNTIHIVTRNHRFQGIISIILALLLVAEIYYYRTQLKDLIRWPTLGIILIIALLAILWYRVPAFKKILGEGKSAKKRSRFQWFAYTGLLIIFLLPISIYYIDSLAIQRPQALEQLSFIAVGIAFSGISFGAASITGMTPESRIGLISVAKKFVLVTILFIFFVPLINIFNFPPFKDIDVNSINLGDPNAWLRGITFYLMSLCFYGGQFLFIFGITDLVHSFIDLDVMRDRK